MSFMLLAILGLVGFTIAGIILIAHAARGRPLTDTRLCRTCRFDLAGINPSSCPECGKPLDTPTATTPRLHKSRVALIWGILLLFIPTGIGITAAAISLSKIQFNQYKPFWMLETEARGPTSPTSTRAISELLRRYKAGSLSMEQAATLLQDALPASSVPKVSWNLAWGDFIGEARSKGAVTDAQWLEYVLFGIELKFFHRPKIRQGVTAPFGFLVTGPRLPNRPTSVQLHATLSGLTVNTTPSKLLDLPASRISIARRGATSCSRAMALDSSPGKHTLQMTVLVAVVDQKDEKKELGSRTFSYQAPLEIVPPNDSIVSTVADPSLVDSIRRSLKIQTLNRYSPDNLSPSFDCKDPPINLAFEVFGRPRDGTQAGKEISLGEVSFLKGSEGAYGVGGQFPADATRADFIFRPSVKAAEANYRLTEIWTGPDIVFENEMVPSFKP